MLLEEPLSSSETPKEAQTNDGKGQLKEGKNTAYKAHSGYRSAVKYLKKMEGKKKEEMSTRDLALIKKNKKIVVKFEKTTLTTLPNKEGSPSNKPKELCSSKVREVKRKSESGKIDN